MKLAAVGLRGAAQLMPAELSGGMARRVGLARAIALDPMLIMYDEPFSGLDPISCNVIGNLVRHLNDALGATSIVVSYDAVESMKVVDYVYLISDGVIAAAGPARKCASPRIPSCASFSMAHRMGRCLSTIPTIVTRPTSGWAPPLEARLRKEKRKAALVKAELFLLMLRVGGNLRHVSAAHVGLVAVAHQRHGDRDEQAKQRDHGVDRKFKLDQQSIDAEHHQDV